MPHTRKSTLQWIKSIIRLIPALALVLSRTGTSAFSAIKFNEYSPISDTFEMILFGMVLVSAFVTTTVTRGFNLYHKTKVDHYAPERAMISHAVPENAIEEKGQDITSDTDDSLEPRNLKEERLKNHLNQLVYQSSNSLNNLVTEEKSEESSGFCQRQAIGYYFLQGCTYLYGIGSTSSGILSMASLLHMAKNLFQFEYSSECHHEANDTLTISTVHAATALLMYTTAKSFIIYNKPLLKNITQKIFKEGHYKDISLIDKVGVGMSATLNSLGVFYATLHIFDQIINSSICHIIPLQTPINILEHPEYKIVSLIMALANFIVTSETMLGALYDKKLRRMKHRNFHEGNELCQFEARPSEFGRFDKPIRACIIFNNIVTALGTFMSFVSLPYTLLGNKDLMYHWAMISTGITMGLISGRNQYYSDMVGFDREELARFTRRLLREERHRAHLQEIIEIDAKEESKMADESFENLKITQKIPSPEKSEEKSIHRSSLNRTKHSKSSNSLKQVGFFSNKKSHTTLDNEKYFEPILSVCTVQ